ncbi:MAG: hypothetical protein V1702_01020 [Candidatus Woesearchaeota archaeon]
MPSGTFLIGKGLSIDAFKAYVQPLMQEGGYSVRDILEVPQGHGISILVSVAGEGDLEKVMNRILVKAGEAVEKVESTKEERLAWAYQVSRRVNQNEWKGLFEPLGVYEADDTASTLFPAIAQRYMLNGIGKEFEALTEQVRSLFEQTY